MTKENSLSLEDICSIITTCAQNNVAKFSYLGLELDFKDKNKQDIPNNIVNNFHGPERDQNKIGKVEVTEIEDDLDDKYLEDLEKDLKGLHIQNAMLEDPELAEAFEFMDDEEIDQILTTHGEA